MDVRLQDIMRSPPPEVTDSTPIVRAVSLLLQPRVEVVVVVSSRTTYSANISFSKEVPLGFISREAIFSRSDCLLPVQTDVDRQSKKLAQHSNTAVSSQTLRPSS